MPTRKQQEISTSTFVNKLANARKDGLTFLTRGYIGSVDDKVVRMYLDLSLETYVDIPRSAVVHAQNIKDDMHERSELMVMGTSDIQLVHQQTHTIKAGDLQRAMDDQKQQAMSANAYGALSKLAGAMAADPCTKAPVDPDCGCAGGSKQKPAPAPASEEQAAPDPVRTAARWMLGPFGLLL